MDTLILEFWPAELLFEGSKCVVICYSSHRKEINQFWTVISVFYQSESSLLLIALKMSSVSLPRRSPQWNSSMAPQGRQHIPQACSDGLVCAYLSGHISHFSPPLLRLVASMLPGPGSFLHQLMLHLPLSLCIRGSDLYECSFPTEEEINVHTSSWRGAYSSLS